MKHHIIEPEVAGGLGEGTIMSRNTHPPIVTRLHYKFDGGLAMFCWKVSRATSLLRKRRKNCRPSR